MSTGTERNPYDSFFSRAFRTPEAARELALNFVPSTYASIVSSGRITVERNRFIDEQLRTHQTDLLIRVAGVEAQDDGADTDLFVVVLVEHRSYPDKWVALQMLVYLMEIWDQEVQTNGCPRGLPPIVPIVLYYGVQRWQGSLEFADLIDTDDPEAGYIPHFEPLLVNLAHVPDTVLTGSLRTITALVFLKLVKRSLRAVGRQLLEVLGRAQDDPAAREISLLALQTLSAVKERDEIDVLQTIARERRYDRLREDVMTYAEELLQEGLEKGRLSDKREVLARLLSRRFTLSESERQRIESCDDPGALDAAIDEFVTAESKDKILARLP